MLSDARPTSARPRRRLLAASSCLLCLWVGCQREAAETPAEARARTGAPRPSADVRASARPGRERTHLTESPSPTADGTAAGWGTSAAVVRPTMPDVVLSDGHASTCRVKVGDTFPNLTLTSLEGVPVALDSLSGTRLTLVVFWSDRHRMSVEQIRRLQKEFVGPYHDAGVGVVAVNVGNSADDARRILSDVPGDFVNLCDPEGEAFRQIATNILPRTYLLRPDLEIVWFDMEYSRSTTRELHRALRYALQETDRQVESAGAQAVTAHRFEAP